MKTDNSKEIYVKLNDIMFMVQFFTYNSGRKGFRLLREEKQVALCTINLGKKDFKENEVIIKDYNENKGMYQALLIAGLIHPYNRRVSVGNNHGLVCKLNMDYKSIENTN